MTYIVLMMRLLPIFILIALATSVSGQSAYKVLDLNMPGKARFTPVHIPESPLLTIVDFEAEMIPFEAYEPFLALNVGWGCVEKGHPEQVEIFFRFKAADQDWGEWISLPYDPHTGDGEHRFFTNLHFEPEQISAVQVRMVLRTEQAPVSITEPKLYLFNPGPTTANKDVLSIAEMREGPCQCMIPAMQSRAQWCPDNTCYPNPQPESTLPSHLIIHHSAGTNVSADWAAVVRSIWNYHVNSNGWSDIGYNWLVDPNGIIYIGRGDQILGAHFCGKNGQTLGTCMLGDFTTATPAAEAITSLQGLLAWKVCAENIHPLSATFHPQSAAFLPNISGHRDGCNTSCPGNAFYPMLPAIRTNVLVTLRQSCTCNLPNPIISQFEAKQDGNHLEWTYAQDTGILFFIERKGPSDLDFQVIDSTADYTYTDPSGVSGALYHYRIQAASVWCYSNLSNEGSIRTQSGKEFEIRPNITQNEVTISIQNDRPEPVVLFIYGMDGRLMWQREYSKPGVLLSILLDIHTFPAGIYVLQLRQGDKQKSTTLTKI